ncbi:hypothetical protein [Atopococcus tabaci]|uniref:hypothetical protein n=1 Tax=Atopococcus tabaci TaxID=269774 RepID=UPI000413A2E6|nr:hypothetical protein [Atopococcus tabaci]
MGTWTVPGNFSDVRGKLTPQWWPRQNSQYGLFRTLRVTPYETLVDGEPISDINLSHINFDKTLTKIRFEVDKHADHVGGLTIFGKEFGNYPQDIEYKLYYSDM